jgi:hypothetical protein
MKTATPGEIASAAKSPIDGPAHSPGAATSTGNAADLLDRVEEVLQKYVVFPSRHALVAVVLWIAATHAQPAWQHATRLIVRSPEKRCGKSRLLDLVVALCHKPLVTVNATVAAVFRSIDAEDPPTLVVDEADAIFNRKANEATEELRGLLNAGFGRGRPALRCVGPKQEPTEFETFAMVALAAIGDAIPDTITDRAVEIPMRRRAPHERVEPYRHRRDGVPLEDLRDELHEWVRVELDALEKAEPVLPIEDRAADVWEPLIALADAAGARWPGLARTAALALTKAAEDHSIDDALATRFLVDIRSVFITENVSMLTSRALVEQLCRLQDSPWEAFGLTPSKLAHRLRPYDVKPEQIRIGDKQLRGYTFDSLTDTFDRYLPQLDEDDPSLPSQGVTASQPQVKAVTPDNGVTPHPVTLDQAVTHLTSTCDGVTVGDFTTGIDS